METLECIKTRAQIKLFNRKKPVDRHTLLKILEAGRMAPSSGNLQNWKFIVVTDEEKKKITARATLQPETVDSAPVVIVVCSLTSDVERDYGERGKNLYAIQNTAAAIENILLAAHDLGLGATWIYAFAETKLRKAFEIRAHADIHAIILIGYPETVIRRPKGKRRTLLARMVWYNKWKGRGAESFWPIGKHLKSAKEKITKSLKRK